MKLRSLLSVAVCNATLIFAVLSFFSYFHVDAASDLFEIYVPTDDYKTIQSAVDAASAGTTIYVEAGTYYEHVTISKENITIIGKDWDNTKVDGNSSGPVFSLLGANNSFVIGFTIKNSGDQPGILLDYNSSGNYITENTFEMCNVAIELKHSWENMIIHNTIQNNTSGIILAIKSEKNVVRENLVSENIEGIQIRAYAHNNLIYKNILLDNYYGIHLSLCNNNSIVENSVSGHHRGIILLGNWAIGVNNTIVYNDISENNEGIHLFWSKGNTIHSNNLVDNRRQVSLMSSQSNYWDNGVEGNFWSDYDGEDSDNDGIGDTPYVIDQSNQDRFPRTTPYMYVKPTSYIDAALLFTLAMTVTVGLAYYLFKVSDT